MRHGTAPQLAALLHLAGSTFRGGSAASNAAMRARVECNFPLHGLAALPECGPAPAGPGHPDHRFGCWKFYTLPGGGVEFLPDGKGIRVWTNDSAVTPVSNDGTVIYLNLPAACVSSPSACVEVRGALSSRSLIGTRLFLQQELFTGFPGRRPPLHNCSRGVDCCFDNRTVEPCVNAPFGKPCRALLASGIALQPASIGGGAAAGNSNSWQYELTSSYDDFDHANDTAPIATSNFSLVVDYETETYSRWRFGRRSWPMSAELGVYEPDVDCAHVQAWVAPEWEFNLRLLPVGRDVPMQAEATLESLEVLVHPTCPTRNGAGSPIKTDDELVKNGDHRTGKVCAIAAHSASPSSEDNAASIQAALTECSTGGTVVVTGGQFKPGPLFIKGANVSLNVDRSVTLNCTMCESRLHLGAFSREIRLR
jgi:hypothetical protein